jgi:hypothetical protein
MRTAPRRCRIRYAAPCPKTSAVLLAGPEPAGLSRRAAPPGTSVSARVPEGATPRRPLGAARHRPPQRGATRAFGGRTSPRRLRPGGEPHLGRQCTRRCSPGALRLRRPSLDVSNRSLKTPAGTSPFRPPFLASCDAARALSSVPPRPVPDRGTNRVGRAAPPRHDTGRIPSPELGLSAPPQGAKPRQSKREQQLNPKVMSLGASVERRPGILNCRWGMLYLPRDALHARSPCFLPPLRDS